jgi:hypothetical protein
MMPVVRISDSVFERLQTHAKPFVDTPASVIERLLDFYEAGRKRARSAASAPPAAAKRFSVDEPPDLTHTKLLSGEIGGMPSTTWNHLVDNAHRRAIQRLKSYDAVRAASLSHIVNGKKTDRGFHYLSDVNMSIQGIDSDMAWRNALHLARKLGVPIQAEFEWREKSSAAFPGKRGLLAWSPPD